MQANRVSEWMNGWMSEWEEMTSDNNTKWIPSNSVSHSSVYYNERSKKSPQNERI